MKKHLMTVAVVCTLGCSMLLPSCIGSFTLTNKLMTWNNSVSNKFVNELIFFAFWVLPVYEVSAIADLLVLNSIEFWSGENPVASQTRTIEGSDGKYLVKNDKNGYVITSLNDGSITRLDFDKKSRSWSLVLPEGMSQTIFTYVDDTHISLPRPDGTQIVVETSSEGLMAYQAIVAGAQFAKN